MVGILNMIQKDIIKEMKLFYYKHFILGNPYKELTQDTLETPGGVI